MKRDDIDKELHRHLGLFSPSANQLAASRESVRGRLREDVGRAFTARQANHPPSRDALRRGSRHVMGRWMRPVAIAAGIVLFTTGLAYSRGWDARSAILSLFMRGIEQTSGELAPVNTPPSTAANVQNQAPVGVPPGPAAAAAPAEPNPTFEEASVRPCDPDNLPPTPQGARGGGANSFQMTPGRTYALCMTLATLVRTAYGFGPIDLEYLQPVGSRAIGPAGRGMAFNNVYGLGVEDGRRVRGGPDWIHEERYTIEAVAAGPADAVSMQGPMLRSLLERRFNLKAHVESEQVPAFNLVVAPGGLKVKPVQVTGIADNGLISADAGGACDPLTPTNGPTVRVPRSFEAIRRGELKPNCGLSVQGNGPNQVYVVGGGQLSAFGRALGGPLGNVRVVDQTGNTDRFNFVFEFVWDDNTPGRRITLPGSDTPNVAPAATIFVALEEQVGLRLEPARAPREFVVIDSVERPSAN